jgi:hypothetical protein
MGLEKNLRYLDLNILSNRLQCQTCLVYGKNFKSKGLAFSQVKKFTIPSTFWSCESQQLFVAFSFGMYYSQ